MWFYFDLPTWLRMIRLAARESGVLRRKLLVRLLVYVPLVATFHAICFALDGLLFPQLRSVAIRTPIFVVGHARSGTTLAHRLMSLDERTSVFRLWELYFPSLIQKKAIRAGARIDARWLGGRLARRVAAWEERRYGKTRHIHAMALAAPEEDDIVFYWSCASGLWITKMPYMGELDFYHVDDRCSPRRRRRLMRFYADCVRRQLVFHGTDKIHLSKNPLFAGRVESLIEAFPDARFVVPMRHPDETIPSLLKLMKVSWGLYHWDDARMQRSLDVLAAQSLHTYRHPLEVLARHPRTPHAVVDYRELVAEPLETITRVYEQLGFSMTPQFRDALAGEQSRARRHETRHAYSLEEFGLKSGAIRDGLADLYTRFGWDAP